MKSKHPVKETLNKLIPLMFDQLTTNGINPLPFVLSLSKDLFRDFSLTTIVITFITPRLAIFERLGDPFGNHAFCNAQAFADLQICQTLHGT